MSVFPGQLRRRWAIGRNAVGLDAEKFPETVAWRGNRSEAWRRRTNRAGRVPVGKTYSLRYKTVGIGSLVVLAAKASQIPPTQIVAQNYCEILRSMYFR